MLERLKHTLLQNKPWVFAFLALVAAEALAVEVLEHEMLRMDLAAYNFAVGFLRRDWLTPFMKALTWAGSSVALLGVGVLLLVFLKDKKLAALMPLNLVFVVLLNQLLKFIVQRPRPEGYRLIAESGYSFPSGHAMVSAAFYGLLIYFVYKKIQSPALKWALTALLALLITAIGFSRIYLGVHYASDVVAGFCISMAYLVLFTRLAHRWNKWDISVTAHQRAS